MPNRHLKVGTTRKLQSEELCVVSHISYLLHSTKTMLWLCVVCVSSVCGCMCVSSVCGGMCVSSVCGGMCVSSVCGGVCEQRVWWCVCEQCVSHEGMHIRNGKCMHGGGAPQKDHTVAL